MKDKAFDPRRLDVAGFAAAGASLDGEADARALPRLVPDAPLAEGRPAHWRAHGAPRRAAGASQQTWLHLEAGATVVQTCQRCLQPMTVPLQVDRWIRFVADEAEAERLDEDSDDDVLAVPARGLDLRALVEDELILALPLVPRHDACPQPLALPPDGPDEAAPRPNPFEALAALKRGGAGGK